MVSSLYEERFEGQAHEIDTSTLNMYYAISAFYEESLMQWVVWVVGAAALLSSLYGLQAILKGFRAAPPGSLEKAGRVLVLISHVFFTALLSAAAWNHGYLSDWHWTTLVFMGILALWNAIVVWRIYP